MSAFNKDDYLNDLPDPDDFVTPSGPAAGQPATAPSSNGEKVENMNDSSEAQAFENASEDAAQAAANAEAAAQAAAEAATEAADAAAAADEAATQAAEAEAQGAAEQTDATETGTDEAAAGSGEAETEEGGLTPLGQAKKEAADYLEALQRERAEFINYRNRTQRDMDRARQQGIIDVLTAMLPALDDVDRIREHGGEMSDSFTAVMAKVDKAFEKFGVEKFGLKGEEFDPNKHDAILHKPDTTVDKPMVDTVVEAGYRIGDRVVRPARVVVASPQD